MSDLTASENHDGELLFFFSIRTLRRCHNINNKKQKTNCFFLFYRNSKNAAINTNNNRKQKTRMICRGNRLQRTPRTPALRSIPEDKSVLFVSRGDKNSDSAIDFFPGLLERDFEDVDVSLVNRSRVIRKVDPLRRSHNLDILAEAHAECMAEHESVYHSVNSVDELKRKLRSEQVGENVLRGQSVYQIHRDTLEKPDSFLYCNMMSDKYDEMGSGRVQGRDGNVYWVLLFRSSTEEWVEE